MIKRSMRWIIAGVAVAAAAFVIGAMIDAIKGRAEDLDPATWPEFDRHETDRPDDDRPDDKRPEVGQPVAAHPGAVG